MPKPKYIKSQNAYYDPNTDTIYAPDSIGEFYTHEMFHARPDTILLNELKPYYENLNDNKLLNMGADLKFVKRIDPNHFFQPEELGARVAVARKILKDVDINEEFLNNLRKNENKYGDNVRDLLKMFNNKNLIQILNMKKQLIPKNQLGGPIARLAQPTNNKGLWGNRGQGNEGQSALENGLSWIWDNFANVGEYASRGLDWAIGAIDPTMTADEAVEQGIARREYESVPHYEMVSMEGKEIPVITYLPPQGGIAPLPTLVAGAPVRVAEAHARLMPKWKSAAVRESLFKHGLGSKKGTPLEQTKSWQAYEKALQEYNDELVYAGLSPHETHVITDVNKRLKRDNKRYQSLVRKQDKEIRETKKQKEATKRSKYMTTGDGRNIADVGRISKKEYDLLDNYMKNSPTLRKKLVKHEARIAETAKSSTQQKQMLESWNIERLKFLRDNPNYLKEVSKLYNMLENNYGTKLDKQLSKLK